MILIYNHLSMKVFKLFILFMRYQHMIVLRSSRGVQIIFLEGIYVPPCAPQVWAGGQCPPEPHVPPQTLRH